MSTKSLRHKKVQVSQRLITIIRKQVEISKVRQGDKTAIIARKHFVTRDSIFSILDSIFEVSEALLP